MVKLTHSPALGRKLRQESLKELEVPTTTRIKEAIEADRTAEALVLVDYLNPEGKTIHDIYIDWSYSLLTFIADTYGEEQLLPALRQNMKILGLSPYFTALASLGTIEEKLKLFAETNHAHRHGPGQIGTFSIIEKPDRYIILLNHCGSGGKARLPDPLDNSPARTEPPYNLGRTKKAYPWSWGKSGVPYYCLHCCVWMEYIPTEINGYPDRVIEYRDDPNVPCSHVIYKNPEDIPEMYFTRIGFKKDITRIRKTLASRKK